MYIQNTNSLYEQWHQTAIVILTTLLWSLCLFILIYTIMFKSANVHLEMHL